MSSSSRANLSLFYHFFLLLNIKILRFRTPKYIVKMSIDFFVKIWLSKSITSHSDREVENYEANQGRQSP